jgi:hypothetical protein
VSVSKDIVRDYLTELKFDLQRYATSWPDFVQDDIIQKTLNGAWVLKLLKNLFGKKSKEVVIVSGLPRSGTSMMMKMLEAGGLEPFSDGIREANVDNPKGYYEFERVKKLPEGDTGWLEEASDKVVKIITALIIHLPDTYTYKILVMRRKMDEIIASQNKMLENRGEEVKVSDEKISQLFNKHLKQAYTWMDRQPNVAHIDVDYNQLLQTPAPILEKVNEFLGGSLDIEKMVAVVDPSLYRQRG